MSQPGALSGDDLRALLKKSFADHDSDYPRQDNVTEQLIFGSTGEALKIIMLLSGIGRRDDDLDEKQAQAAALIDRYNNARATLITAVTRVTGDAAKSVAIADTTLSEMAQQYAVDNMIRHVQPPRDQSPRQR